MNSFAKTKGDRQRTDTPHFHLVLYVCGATPHCMLAIKNINDICENYLKGVSTIEIIDVIQHPEAAVQAQIIAAPTLIKLEPGPVRRLIGDLSNTNKVLASLGIYDGEYIAS